MCDKFTNIWISRFVVCKFHCNETEQTNITENISEASERKMKLLLLLMFCVVSTIFG